MNVDYGPLTKLIGTFEGDKGVDIAPDPDGIEENHFYETIIFTQIGTVTNVEEQTLAAVHYVLNISRKGDNVPIHHQTGYWMWDKEQDEISQSIAIPRAVTVLSLGKATKEGEKITLEVSTDESGVVQTSFMHKKAKTTSFKHKVILEGDELFYEETTMVDIYGKSFEHTDTNKLKKIQG